MGLNYQPELLQSAAFILKHSDYILDRIKSAPQYIPEQTVRAV